MTLSTTRGALALCALGLASSCGSPGGSHAEVLVNDAELSAYLSDKPAQLRPLYTRLLREGRRNEALNSMEIGLVHFERGEFDLAASAFDSAIGVVEAFYVDDAAAEAARTSFYENEDVKDFKGEPYERVMLYYYRGLTHLAQGHLTNARAAFRMASAHDAIAEEEQNRCDFASMIYLQGVLAMWDGDQGWASNCFRQVEKLRPELEIPATPPATLVICETGACPVKIVDGVDGQRLTLHRNHETTARQVGVVAPAGDLHVAEAEDIYWQSSTRGGRFVDSFLEGKAHYKADVQDFTRNRSEDMQLLQLAGQLDNDPSGVFGAAGVALSLGGLFAGRVQAKADSRHWRNLPDRLHLAIADEPLQLADLQVVFSDDNGRALGGPAASTEIDIKGTRRVLWVRNRSASLSPVSNR